MTIFKKNPIYDFTLTEWIMYGLHKGNLKNIVDTIEEGRNVENRLKIADSNKKYIEKILREEIIKQFSQSNRPVLEVILNSIDAQPIEALDYTVNISAKKKKAIISDFGKGMELEDILKLLVVPFSTEKDGINEIGRFGVGFLSTFNYCIEKPFKNIVRFETETSKGRYRADFYAEGKEVGDMKMKLSKRNRDGRNGTIVTIHRNFGNKKDLADYINGDLHTMSPLTAKLVVNNYQINNVDEKNLFVSPVELVIRGKKINQRVGIAITKINPEFYTSTIQLTASGVKVHTSASAGKRDTIVYFPSAIKVVEGRDEFKIDENYNASVRGVFEAVRSYINNRERNGEFISEMIDFIPALMSAFGMKHLYELPNIDEMTNDLLPGRKYALVAGQLNKFADFFGDEVRNLCFETTSQGCSFWRDKYASEKIMLLDVMGKAKTLSLRKFVNKLDYFPDFFPNARPLRRSLKVPNRYERDKYEKAVIIHGKSDTRSCLMVHDKILYFNANHTYLNSKEHPAHAYSVLSSYLNSFEVREIEKIEHFDEAENLLNIWIGRQELTTKIHPELVSQFYRTERIAKSITRENRKNAKRNI